METVLWRVPALEIHSEACIAALMADRERSPAAISPNGDFWFADTPAEVQPLLLFGTFNQIFSFLEQHCMRSIRNGLSGHGGIYVGLFQKHQEAPLLQRISETLAHVPLLGAGWRRPSSPATYRPSSRDKRYLLLINHMPGAGLHLVSHDAISFSALLKQFVRLRFDLDVEGYTMPGTPLTLATTVSAAPF